MKSCLSLALTLIIVVLIVASFIGTALFLWHGSSTTEFSEGPFIEAPAEPVAETPKATPKLTPKESSQP